LIKYRAVEVLRPLEMPAIKYTVTGEAAAMQHFGRE
jgi:hypothetical protein